MAGEDNDNIVHIDLEKDTYLLSQEPQNFEDRIRRFIETPAPWEKKDQKTTGIVLELVDYPECTGQVTNINEVASVSEDLKSTLPLNDAYAFGAEHGLEREVTEIRAMAINWGSYESSLRRGYVVALFEEHGIFDEFKEKCWPFGNTPGGETRRRRYLRIRANYVEYLSGACKDGGVDQEPESVPTEQAFKFALEAHLRDFLAEHLDQIEKGLDLYDSPEHDGVEFPVDGGRIDVLAVDSGGKFVVIELKLSSGRNKALGQLLYYMGWVDKNLGKGPCRGLIIASDISGELPVAVSRVPGVSLAKYRMNFSIEPISQA